MQPPNQVFDPSIPDGALQAPEIIPHNFRNSVLNSWFVGIQRELPLQLTLDMAYVGNQGAIFSATLMPIHRSRRWWRHCWRLATA